MIARRPLPVALALAWCGLVPPPALAAREPGGGATGVDVIAIAAPDSAGAEASLEGTTAPPWNPPRPIPDAEPWESALRLPSRVATLPVAVVGAVLRTGLLHAEESYLVPKTLYFLSAPARTGLQIQPASLGDRTGFGLSVGWQPTQLRRLVLAEWSGSMLDYTRAFIRVGRPRAGVEYVSEWRPEDRFFGLGPGSDEQNVSRYAAHAERFLAKVRAPLAPKTSVFAQRATLDLWVGAQRLATSRGRGDDASPSLEARFPALAPALDRTVSHLVSGARAALDGRSGAPHWNRGGRVALGWETQDALRSSFLFPATRAASFARWTLEAEGGVSFMRDPRTIRLAARAIHTIPRDGASGAIPDGFSIADLVALGGSPGLEGFEPGRFHDLDALALRLTWIFPLAHYVEMDLHVEQGGVYRDVFEEPRLSGLRTSYGAAIRPRNDRAPLGSIGVEWSAEAIRVRYSLGGVE